MATAPGDRFQHLEAAKVDSVAFKAEAARAVALK
jgi:hypothetical protein